MQNVSHSAFIFGGSYSLRRKRERLALRALLVFYEPPRSNRRHSPLQASFQMRIALIILGLVSLRELVPSPPNEEREATLEVASLFVWWSIGDSTRGANYAPWSLAVANVHRKFALCRSSFEPPLPIKKSPTRPTRGQFGLFLVEHRGLEPLTPTLPVSCAPSCANAPKIIYGLFYHILYRIVKAFCENREFFEKSCKKSPPAFFPLFFGLVSYNYPAIDYTVCNGSHTRLRRIFFLHLCKKRAIIKIQNKKGGTTR